MLLFNVLAHSHVSCRCIQKLARIFLFLSLSVPLFLTTSYWMVRCLLLTPQSDPKFSTIWPKFLYPNNFACVLFTFTCSVSLALQVFITLDATHITSIHLHANVVSRYSDFIQFLFPDLVFQLKVHLSEDTTIQKTLLFKNDHLFTMCVFCGVNTGLGPKSTNQTKKGINHHRMWYI